MYDIFFVVSEIGQEGAESVVHQRQLVVGELNSSHGHEATVADQESHPGLKS